MIQAVLKLMRSARLPGLLHLLVCAAVLASGLLAQPAFAGLITNTASLSFTVPFIGTVSSPSNTLAMYTVPAPTPSVPTFYQYDPGAADALNIPFDGGSRDTGGGNFVALPAPLMLDGTPISLAAPVQVRPTTVYHAGEPVFLTLADGNRNVDPTVREFVIVTVTTSTGDTETLKLEETGPDTGLFAGVIQSTTAAVTTDDGKLSVGENSSITVHYTDVYYQADKTQTAALVDPFGTVFDTTSGLPVDGVSVTIIDVTTGKPADVFGDDGVSKFPSTIISGTSAQDTSGKTYTFPAGGYRFPYAKPGNYRYAIVPVEGYTAPSDVPVADMPKDPNKNAYIVVTGSFSDPFVVDPGPALHIDIPIDPKSHGLVMQKTVSQASASAGDFLQYQLTLQNTDPFIEADGVTVVDHLPQGMRYQAGSLHLGTALLPDPAISSDGRTLTFSLPYALNPSSTASMHYVVVLGAGVVPGQAINTAQAMATIGKGKTPIASNTAKVAVAVTAPFFSAASTLIGRVYQGSCNTPFALLKGVANVRIMLEDGSYVITDKDGQYHFEGVTPGTHVAQLDTDSLPKGMETISCVDNTRFAGSSYSQFVQVQGGSLWRADFFTRVKPAQPDAYSPKAVFQRTDSTTRSAEVGIRLESQFNQQTSSVAVMKQGIAAVAPMTSRSYTLHAEFDSCRATLRDDNVASLQPLIKDLKDKDVSSIELTGYTDNQRLSARCKKLFADNNVLSKARAQTVADELAKALGLQPEQLVVAGRGSDNPVASNSTKAGMARNRRTEVIVHIVQAATDLTVAAPEVQAGVKTHTTLTGLTHRIELDGTAPVTKLTAQVVLPRGTHYVPDSTRLDGKIVANPELLDSYATFRLGDIAKPEWHLSLTFDVLPDTTLVLKAPSQAQAADAPVERSTFNLNARFEPCSASYQASTGAAISKLAGDLKGMKIDHIEVVGNTDNQHLSGRCKIRFADNKGLSLARASVVGQALATTLSLRPDQIVARGDGEDKPIASNATAEGRAQNRRTEVLVYGQKAAALAPVAAGLDTPEVSKTVASTYEIKAYARFEATPQKGSQTPMVSNKLVYGDGKGPAELSQTTFSADGSKQASSVLKDSSHRETIKLMVETQAAATEKKEQQKISQEVNEKRKARDGILDDVTAAGGKTDWLKGQDPGIQWLFPIDGHNPRGPSVRIAIKHDPLQTVVLKRISGEPVDPLNFEGDITNGEKTITVSVWRGVPISDGPNVFVADIKDVDGKVVHQLIHTVVFAGSPVHAEVVESESVLMADGITKSVLAVRLTDRDGHPVRAGYTGTLDLMAPYISQQQVDEEQKRQLAGLDRFKPQYRVEGDDGIAYIDLAPTTVSGSVHVNLTFQTGPDTSRTQQLQAWMAPGARKWVVVGFAEGTAGFNTLKSHMATGDAAAASGMDKGVYTDEQVSLYAKGTVQGKWLMTMAYNTDKASNDGSGGRQASISSAIDPKKFYTLYGDGSAQRYDAASQSKLYLKLERGQFYALFGDYNTGLTQTKLSRYNRTLNGVKAENAGGPVNFVMFAADTPQNYSRDEIQGNGTSGLYHLSKSGIVLNSEQITVETRDRLHSENIISSQQMVQHIDYELDYDNGTIFFKQPVNSRDHGFNPIFIVAEYETIDVSSKELDAGGRAAVKLADGKVEVGATVLRDEQNLQVGQLGGMDLKVKLPGDAEIRVEAARSKAPSTAVDPGGNAWLAEYEHHDARTDTLVYSRTQAEGFGVNQQNASEAGMQKTGVDQQVRLSKNWSVQGEVYNQNNTSSDDQRNAVLGKLQYKTEQGGMSVGAQAITDHAGGSTGGNAGGSYSSDQATVAGNRFFMNRRLELSGEMDSALGGQNSSIDYPNRYVATVGYNVTENTKLIAAQEVTDGSALSSTTTRVGVQLLPWKGAHLDSTLNQSQISENGPRTFGNFGLHQGVVLNKQWALDFSTDSSHTFSRGSNTSPVVQGNEPIAASGSQSAASALTENYNAFSEGATYRNELWSWAGRAEVRNGSSSDRDGLTSSFLRQAEAGVALASTAQVFRTNDLDTGTSGSQVSADVALAWRPLGTQWSVLDRLEYRFNSVSNGTGASGSGLFGNNSLVTNGDANTRHLINNFALNHVSREWNEVDQRGNLFARYERSQWSLYYGNKYASDTFDGKNYKGYTDLLGLEARHDLTPALDLGVQASVLNGWTTHTHAYSFGPAVGYTPLPNGWVTLGYNFRGFHDSDFDAARYTGQGIYLQLRIKFDQNTRLGGKDELPFASAKAAGKAKGQVAQP
jgi:uncharacterized repeat protein (TIGR01451 family)